MFGRSANRRDLILIAILLAEAAAIWGLGRWETKHNH